MSAKIRILVKDTSMYSKVMGNSVADNFFHPIRSYKAMYEKYKLLVAVDEEEPQLLKASKNPYEFTVNAGHHTVVTLDPKKEGKQSNWKLVGGFMGATFGMANGNIYTTMMGGESGSNFVSDMISAGASTMEFVLAEGDVIKIQCKATLTGKVTMKTV